MSNVALIPKSRDFTWPGCQHSGSDTADRGICMHLLSIDGGRHEPCDNPANHARTCPWVTGLTYHEAMNASTNHDDHDNPIPGCFACDRMMNEDVAVDR